MGLLMTALIEIGKVARGELIQQRLSVGEVLMDATHTGTPACRATDVVVTA